MTSTLFLLNFTIIIKKKKKNLITWTFLFKWFDELHLLTLRGITLG